MTEPARFLQSRSRRLLRWAPALLLGGLLLWGLRGVDGAAWRSHLMSLPAGVWLVALLGGLLGHACRAWRLQTEWRAWSVPTRFGPALRIALLHNAWTQLLPLRAGELSYVWLLRRHAGVGWHQAAGSLLWLRLQDAVVLGALALLTGAATLLSRWNLAASAWPGGVRTGGGVGVLLLGAVLLVAVGLAVAGGRVMRATEALRLMGPLRRRLAHGPGLGLGTRSNRAQAWAAAWQHRHGGPQGWLLCAAHWAVKLTVAAWLLATVATLPLTVTWVAAVGGELGAVLPLQAPAGLGPYEAGLWAGARWAHTGPVAIRWAGLLPQALLVHGLSIGVSLAAAAVAAATSPRPPAVATAPPPDAAAASSAGALPAASDASTTVASPPWTPCPP